MAKKITSKTHVVLDSDVSEMLQKISGETGLSMTYLANQYLRMIKSVQHASAVELKDGATIIPRTGSAPITFEKRAVIQIDLGEL